MVNARYKIMNLPEPQISIWPWKCISGGHDTLQGWLFHMIVSQWGCVDIWMCEERNLFMLKVFLCGNEVEIVGHLFLHCRVKDHLWKIFIISEVSLEQCLARLFILILARRSWNWGKGHRRLENHSCVYMVDHLERRKCQVLRIENFLLSVILRIEHNTED